MLGPSLLNFDRRGIEYLDGLRATLKETQLYEINGNTLGNHCSVTKLKWLKEHQPDLYHRADKLLLWGSFVAFMLGAEPAIDYSLANRTLLFDIDRGTWSEDLFDWAGLASSKLPRAVAPGTPIGTVSRQMATELGMPSHAVIVAGAHDQCANALGCGVLSEGQATYGMGTYICITPIFSQRKDPLLMIQRGLNTEHHAFPGKYVTFIYNQGGALLKWFRDTFAVADPRSNDLYTLLIAETPDGPSKVMALPHWAPCGPPHFISDSCGILAGLN